MSSALRVTPLAARRFLCRALGLDAPFGSIADALRHHGYVQIDPIDVCGRMHDLILRNRVAGYREGDLMRFLHGGDEAESGSRNERPARLVREKRPRVESPAPPEPAPPPLPAERRRAFEHHLPDTGVLVALEFEAWPHLQATMRARTKRAGAWSGRLTPRERELAPTLLAEIAARGPLGSEDFADERRAHRPVWGAASLVKSALQKLFFHGRLLIAQRVNNRRRYTVPERVLPAPVLAASEPTAAETARWLALLKLRQRRLVLLKREEQRLIADLIQTVAIENGPTLHCLRADVPLLQACEDPGSSSRDRVQLLAPLDPLIYDRRLTRSLWNFDYTWEVYTPPAKRVRGYYALPILAGTELVGHVEPRRERASGKVSILSRSTRRGVKTATAVTEFAQWLGAVRRG